jgi:hypothetical protein
MRDLRARNGADLVCLECDDCRGSTVERQELHFVGSAISIDVNDRTHIPSDEVFGRDRGRQYNPIMFLDHLETLLPSDMQ